MKHNFPFVLALVLAAVGCRSAPPPIPDAPQGSYSGEGVTLFVDPESGPLRGVGSIDGHTFAFVESPLRHFDVQLMDESGAQAPARLSFDARGRVVLQVEGEDRVLVPVDVPAELAPARYAGSFECGLPLNARILRQDQLVVGQFDVIGAPYTILTTSSSDGHLSGFLEGPEGPELPVRATISESEILLQVTGRPVVRARRLK